MASDVSADRPRTPHQSRFYALYGVLGLALGAAAAAAAIGITSHGARPAPAWSPWQPTGGGLGRSEQIARHVGGEYRLPGGAQLDDVIAKAPSVAVGKNDYPVGYVATPRANGASAQVDTVSGSNSVMFALCGLGESCTIATGKPSIARGLVVLREILELSLYTFHYESGIDSVIALMPPRSAAAAPTVVYLRRSDLGPELNVPLGRTLSPHAPEPSTMTAREVEIVDATTARHTYTFSLTRAQDGNTILILSRAA